MASLPSAPLTADGVTAGGRAGRQSCSGYSLRLEVIKEIRRIARVHRSSEPQAMWVLQHHHQQMGYSLDRQGWREGERFYYPGPHTELTADAGIYIPIATHMTPCLCPFTVDRPFLRDTS
jgi:hypothetical protein